MPISKVTTERLRQIASGNAFTCTQDDESAAMAAELLAVREAQSVPVEQSVPVKWEYIKGIEQYFIGAPKWATHYLAFDTGLHRSWADGKHPGARLKSCNGGDESVMCHPFLWGVMGERHITAPPAPAVPDFGALTKLIVGRLIDCGTASDDSIADAEVFVYNACRAAMLKSCDTVRDLSTPVDPQIAEYEQALDMVGMSVSVDVSTSDDNAGYRYFGRITEVQQSANPKDKGSVVLLVQDDVESNFDDGIAPDGYKLMPIDMTDDIGEAIAMEANCCGGIALDIYNAALAAAPTPTK